MPRKNGPKQIQCKECGKTIPDNMMFCGLCGATNWPTLMHELIVVFALAVISIVFLSFSSDDIGLRVVGFLAGFIAFASGRRAFLVLLSTKSRRLGFLTQHEDSLKEKSQFRYKRANKEMFERKESVCPFCGDAAGDGMETCEQDECIEKSKRYKM